MFGTVGGAILLLLGLLVVTYTVYKMLVSTPTQPTEWVFQSLYLIAGLVVAYYGYQTLYPPVPVLFAGRRR